MHRSHLIQYAILSFLYSSTAQRMQFYILPIYDTANFRKNLLCNYTVSQKMPGVDIR